MVDFCYTEENHRRDTVGTTHIESSSTNPLIEIVNWVCVDDEEAKNTIRHELTHGIVNYCADYLGKSLTIPSFIFSSCSSIQIDNANHGEVFMKVLLMIEPTDKINAYINEQMKEAREIAIDYNMNVIERKMNESLFWSNHYMYDGDIHKTAYWDRSFEFWRLMQIGRQNSKVTSEN